MAHSDDPGDPTMQRDNLLFGTDSVIDNLPTKMALPQKKLPRSSSEPSSRAS
jgi:hypothetical protein